MCIIAIKKKGVKFPKVETIKTMCDNNPDGFALVYHVDGQDVRQIRSLESKDIYKAYRKLLKHSPKHVSFFMHARVKTHGTININNCHGWHSDECSVYFAHNGILSVKNRDDMTDSETFLRDIFTPCFLIGGWSAAEKAINACIGTSKFVFMNDDGEIKHYGNYIDDDGMLYSNSTYKEERWSSNTYYSYKQVKPKDIKFKYGDKLKYVGKWGLSGMKCGDIVTVDSVHTYGFYVLHTSKDGKYSRFWVNEYYVEDFIKVADQGDVKKLLNEKKAEAKTDNVRLKDILFADDILECTASFRSTSGRFFKAGDLIIVVNVYDTGLSAVSESGANIWLMKNEVLNFINA